MRKLLRQMLEYLHLPENIQGVLDLLSVGFVVIYVAHFCACCWHLMALIEDQFGVQNNWLDSNNLTHESIYTRYVYSLFYSVQTMITVGIIKLETHIERAFSTVLCLILSGVFAYSLNSVGYIMQEMFKNENELKTKIRDITHFMRRRKINMKLQTKIRRFIEYMHTEEKQGTHRGEYLIGDLSNNLRNELYVDSYGKILRRKIRFLGKNFSQKFLNQLPLKVKELTLAPEEMIYSQGDNDQILYYVMNGQIETYQSEIKGQAFQGQKFYEIGGVFGLQGFITGQLRDDFAKSIKVSQVLYITREDFVELLHEFPKDFETFHQIKDQILLYERFQKSSIECESCNSKSHQIRNCQFLTFSKDQLNLSQKLRGKNFQERCHFQRQIITKRNSLQLKQIIKFKIFSQQLKKLKGVLPKFLKEVNLNVFERTGSGIIEEPFFEEIVTETGSQNDQSFEDVENQQQSDDIPFDYRNQSNQQDQRNLKPKAQFSRRKTLSQHLRNEIEIQKRENSPLKNYPPTNRDFRMFESNSFQIQAQNFQLNQNFIKSPKNYSNSQANSEGPLKQTIQDQRFDSYQLTFENPNLENNETKRSLKKIEKSSSQTSEQNTKKNEIGSFFDFDIQNNFRNSIIGLQTSTIQKFSSPQKSAWLNRKSSLNYKTLISSSLLQRKFKDSLQMQEQFQRISSYSNVSREKNQESKFANLENFETVKSYSKYFVHNNIEKILELIMKQKKNKLQLNAEQTKDKTSKKASQRHSSNLINNFLKQISRKNLKNRKLSGKLKGNSILPQRQQKKVKIRFCWKLLINKVRIGIRIQRQIKKLKVRKADAQGKQRKNQQFKIRNYSLESKDLESKEKIRREDARFFNRSKKDICDTGMSFEEFCKMKITDQQISQMIIRSYYGDQESQFIPKTRFSVQK